MRFQRRGKRTKPVLFARQPIIQTVRHNPEEELLWFIHTIQKPTAELPPVLPDYGSWYESLSQTQQKNLIDQLVNQILFAHMDIRQRVFSHLHRISSDFGQKTQVEYHRRRMEVSANR